MRTKNALFLAAATTAAGCASTSDPGGAPAPRATASAAVAPLRPLDRRQSAYVVTSLKSRTGATFQVGGAELKVLEIDGRPSVMLELVARREDQELAIWMSLGSRVPQGETLSFEQNPSSSLALTVRRTDVASGEPVTQVRGRASLHVEQSGNARPRLVGSVDTGDPDASFELSTEFQFSCWTRDPRSTGPGDGRGVDLREDLELASAFCERFADFR